MRVGSVPSATPLGLKSFRTLDVPARWEDFAPPCSVRSEGWNSGSVLSFTTSSFRAKPIPGPVRAGRKPSSSKNTGSVSDVLAFGPSDRKPGACPLGDLSPSSDTYRDSLHCYRQRGSTGSSRSGSPVAWKFRLRREQTSSVAATVHPGVLRDQDT